MLSGQYAGWGAKIGESSVATGRSPNQNRLIPGLFFGPLAAISCVLIYFVFLGAKGRTYSELDELFERRIPAWRFSKTQTQAQMAAEG